MVWEYYCLVLLVVRGAVAVPSLHYCQPTNTPRPIIIDEGSRWGQLLTPGFPNYMETPLRCQWVLDLSHYKHKPDWNLFLYFTQVYVHHELISLRQCTDISRQDCKQSPQLTRSAFFRQLTGPILEITLDIPDRQDVHIRVMEVSDVYGLNMTYEVARVDQRAEESFFKCSLATCRLNGQCIVQGSMDGSEVDRMECRCNSPLDDSPLPKPRFYGEHCEYHNKHGHCTGPGDKHFDAAKRCSGQPCSYFTSRFVRCNCDPGYGGKSCELQVDDRQEQEHEEGVSTEHNIKLNIDLDSRSFVPSATEVGSAWQSVCNCTVLHVKQRRSTRKNEVEVYMRGDLRRTRSILRTINKMHQITRGIPLARDVVITSYLPQVRIENLSLNQENPVLSSHEFIISCLAEGSQNMQFAWFKDDAQVNVSVTQRYIMQDVLNRDQVVGMSDRWRYVGILHVTNAKKYDSGYFRCEVNDEGSRVSLGLGVKVLVSEEPEIEIFPSALVLEQANKQIINSVKDSTIFCLTKNTVDSHHYSFKWFRRYAGADKSQNMEVNFARDPEELEVLTLPVGLLLRLKKVRRSAVYTCRATLGNKITELEVSVSVVPRELVEETTCLSPEGSWPTALINTLVSRPCPGDDVGFVKRRCEQRIVGLPGQWGPTNQEDCVRRDLLMYNDHLQTFISGYTKPGEAETLGGVILMNLVSLCKMSPRGKEWSLMLQMLVDVVTYLHELDSRFWAGRRYDWSNQISRAKGPFFNLIKCLLSSAKSYQLNAKLGEIVELLRRNSLLMGRQLRPSNITTFPFQPYGHITAAKIDLKQVDYETRLVEEPQPQGGDQRSAFQPGIEVYVSARNEVLSIPRDHVFVVSLIYMEQLDEAAHAIMDSGGAKGSKYELNSHLVTIGLESEKRLGKSQLTYQPADMFSIDGDFIFSIEFTFRNLSFNRTLRSVKCGEVLSGSHRDLPRLVASPSCELRFTNRTGEPVPTCLCGRVGTYGLLVTRPHYGKAGVPVSGLSKPVLCGCSINLVLSLLTWTLLLKSYSQHSRKLITILKILTASGLIASSLIFMCRENRAIPEGWNHATSSALQLAMLTGPAAQLGISVLVLLHHKPFIYSGRVWYVFAFLVSALGPALVVGLVSVGCRLDDPETGDWWVKLGGFHFNGYVSVLSALLVFLALILGFTWTVLARQRRTTGFEALKNSGLKEDVGTLKRVLVMSVVLVVYNAASVVYFNTAGSQGYMGVSEYAFSLLCMCVGLSSMFCYVVWSESYILVWCGDKQTWREIKLQQQQHRRESRSDSGGSRSTSSSGNVPTFTRGEVASNGFASTRNGAASGRKGSRNGGRIFRKEAAEMNDQYSGMREVNCVDCSLDGGNYPLHSVGSNPSVSMPTNSGARGPMEVRPLVKTRCYIRDSRPVSPAARTQPEPLAELLGRVSKHPRPLSLVGEQGAKQGTAAAFSNEYRSSSRRSTMTSNMTLVTTSDVSEYVQQENNDPQTIHENHWNVSPSSHFNTYAPMSPDSLIPEEAGPGAVFSKEHSQQLENYSRFSNYINSDEMVQNRLQSSLTTMQTTPTSTSNPAAALPSPHYPQEVAPSPLYPQEGFLPSPHYPQEVAPSPLYPQEGFLPSPSSTPETAISPPTYATEASLLPPACPKRGLLKKIQSACEMTRDEQGPPLQPLFSSHLNLHADNGIEITANTRYMLEDWKSLVETSRRFSLFQDPQDRKEPPSSEIQK